MKHKQQYPRLAATDAHLYFDYDPSTGILTSKTGWAAGSHGTIVSSGYLQIGFQRNRYMVHRLAWAVVHGEWPPAEIDHINGVRDDNRLVNLRLATTSENKQNRPRHKNNKLGVKGVCKVGNKYRAQCWRDGRFVLQKHFDTLEEAAAAYRAVCLAEFGVFARPE